MNSLHQVENWATGGSFSSCISKLCFQQQFFSQTVLSEMTLNHVENMLQMYTKIFFV